MGRSHGHDLHDHIMPYPCSETSSGTGFKVPGPACRIAHVLDRHHVARHCFNGNHHHPHRLQYGVSPSFRCQGLGPRHTVPTYGQGQHLKNPLWKEANRDISFRWSQFVNIGRYVKMCEGHLGLSHPKNATRPIGMSPMSRPPAQLDTPAECHFAIKQDRTMGGQILQHP